MGRGLFFPAFCRRHPPTSPSRIPGRGGRVDRVHDRAAWAVMTGEDIALTRPVPTGSNVVSYGSHLILVCLVHLQSPVDHA